MEADRNRVTINYFRNEMGWSEPRILTAMGGLDEGSIGPEFCKEVLDFMCHENVDVKNATQIILERRKRRAIDRSRALHPSNQPKRFDFKPGLN